jgi:hypothetical protein
MEATPTDEGGWWCSFYPESMITMLNTSRPTRNLEAARHFTICTSPQFVLSHRLTRVWIYLIPDSTEGFYSSTITPQQFRQENRTKSETCHNFRCELRPKPPAPQKENFFTGHAPLLRIWNTECGQERSVRSWKLPVVHNKARNRARAGDTA